MTVTPPRRPVTTLEYGRMLRILAQLPSREEADYVLKILLAHDQDCQAKIAATEAELIAQQQHHSEQCFAATIRAANNARELRQLVATVRGNLFYLERLIYGRWDDGALLRRLDRLANTLDRVEPLAAEFAAVADRVSPPAPAKEAA